MHANIPIPATIPSKTPIKPEPELFPDALLNVSEKTNFDRLYDILI
jgi:hypothetical protein